ncbi:MAG: c-type cytochrome [Nitrospira sp.]|nr:c-type cytochrome [Nitrospira sp.]
MEQRDVVREQTEVKVKVEGRHLAAPLYLRLSLGLILLVGWLGIVFAPGFDRNVWAESSVSQPGVKLKANVERGRDIFHGKGACSYCHGMDGYLDRLPQMKEDIAALIARLNPPPTDLRNPGVLRLKTNKERARAIREGHPGTGMFPDRTMTNQDLADTLFYLAFIRKDPNPEKD